jgi:hypothetical protein
VVEDYKFSEADIVLLRAMAAEYMARKGNTGGRGLTKIPPPTAPETYVARTPAGGIPAMDAGTSTGTGTTSLMDDVPGYAECTIYQLLHTGSTGPHLEPIPSLTRRVYNLSNDDIPGNVWIVVTRDKWGAWYPVGAGGDWSGTFLLVLAEITDQVEFPDNCELGGTDCPSIYHFCILQQYDPACDAWVDSTCVYGADVNGRKLEVGRRYPATLGGIPPTILTAAILPVEFECIYGGNTPVYLVDVGDPVRVVFPLAEIGVICESDSGSGTGEADANNLRIYSGEARRWNGETCEWDIVEDNIYIAEMHGCDLEIGRKYGGQYERMVRTENAPTGTGSPHQRLQCSSLYLVDHKPEPPQGVSDIFCVGGRLKVYKWVAVDDCGTVESRYDHDAGCCECDENPGSTGTGTESVPGGIFDECDCAENPTEWAFSLSGITNNLCASGDCSKFNATHILTHSGVGQWSNNLTVTCDFFASVGMTLECGVTEWTLSLGLGATYTRAAADWNCLEANVMTLVAGSPTTSCNGWPAVITVVPN